MRKISFAVPVFNEEENVEKLFGELRAVADGLAVPYEVLFVDDGSIDRGLRVIRELAKRFPEVWGLHRFLPTLMQIDAPSFPRCRKTP